MKLVQMILHLDFIAEPFQNKLGKSKKRNVESEAQWYLRMVNACSKVLSAAHR